MKNLKQVLLSTLFLCTLSHVFAQSADKELEPGYYVIVGAYASSKEASAQRFTEALIAKGYMANYGFNSRRALYFVYLSYFTTLKASLKEMEIVRRKGKFEDAWVRVVAGDIVSSKPSEIKPVIPNLLESKKTEPVKSLENKSSEKATDTTKVSASDTTLTGVTDNAEIKQYEHMTLGNTEVFLSLYNARNNRIVDGEVQVIDTERARRIMKVKGNEYLLLPDPKSKSGQLTLICESFGYRKIQQEINYPFPLADTVKPYVDLVGTTVVINFDLVRYHRGDISTLYDVYFYNDAALMLPESKYELNSLLQMMQENPKYRIRLHGHTNGNYHGKILSVGTDKNFFSLNGAKEEIGSAKELSYKRAEVIKDFLVANGVDATRVEIKAWGGKRQLYDKQSVNAKKNVRVEVEIIDE